MPELPEVETVRRGLAPVLVNARCAHVELRCAQLRFPFPRNFAGALAGRKFDRLERRAKYLLAHLDNGRILVMHLGMSGSFRTESYSENTSAPYESTNNGYETQIAPRRPHDHVVIHLAHQHKGQKQAVIYNDPRRFGFMLLLAGSDALNRHPFFAQLGAEPLDQGFSGASIATLFAGRNLSLKGALLNQKLIAGIGNIYASEALFGAGLSPRRSAATLALRGERPGARAHRLATAIQDVLRRAISAGGASLRDHRQTDGSSGYFQHEFDVYGRMGAACPRTACTGTIERIVQNGRATYFCPVCQR